jgi:hypothetical protein
MLISMRVRWRVAIGTVSLLLGAALGAPGCASRPLLSCPPVPYETAIAVPEVSATVRVNTRLSARANAGSVTIAIDDNQGRQRGHARHVPRSRER